MPKGGDAMRGFNRGRVLDAVRAGATTRLEVGAGTGLARSTVTSLVQELLDTGRLAEADGASPPGAGRGRPARRLVLAARRTDVLAIDFGHSHCRVAVVAVSRVDAEGAVASAEVRAERSVALDVDADPDAALAKAFRLARQLCRTRGVQVEAGGIGLPAPVDIATGSVGTGNLLPRWVDRHPARELGQLLGLPFAVDNDANLGALAEAGLGAAVGATDLVYVKAATGIGAGLLLGGRIHHGLGGRAGEIGHVPLDANGPLCRCGNRGCLETLASITEVLAAAQNRIGSWDALLDLIAAGDPGASRVVGDAGRLIGRVLADLVNTLSPQQIVLGGDLASAGAPLRDGVAESINRFAQPGLARRMTISLGRLGTSAELYGAALHAASLVPT